MDKKLAFVAAVALGVVLGLMNIRPEKPPQLDYQEVDSLRNVLREMVEEGELTKVEAQVRLAEAIAEEKARHRKRQARKKQVEGVAMERKLKQSVEAGAISEQEAAAKLEEWKRKAKGKIEKKKNEESGVASSKEASQGQ